MWHCWWMFTSCMGLNISKKWNSLIFIENAFSILKRANCQQHCWEWNNYYKRWVDDYNMNECNILDYTNVKSINIKNYFLSFLFVYLHWHVWGIFPRTTTSNKVFHEEPFQEIRDPCEEPFVEKGLIDTQGTPNGSWKVLREQPFKAIQNVLRGEPF